MKVHSLFSGVGGIDLGLERAGFEIVSQCEIDPFRRDILRRHWPRMEVHDDVQSVHHPQGSADLVVGGFPCQDLSVAGRRAGLDAARSGLFFEFARVADECVAPGGWILIENVPGLLSSPGRDRDTGEDRAGRDFGVLLSTLVDLGFRDIAWRVLDSRYFGVPQRRRRVFILARRADGQRAAKVLLEPEGDGGHPEEGRKKGKKHPRAARERPRGGGDPALARRGEGAADELYGHFPHSREIVVAIHPDAIARDGVSRTPGPDAEGRVRKRDAGLGLRDDGSVYTLSTGAPPAVGPVPVGLSTRDASVSGTLGKKGEGGGGLGLDREGAMVVVARDVAAPLTRGHATGAGVSVPGRRQEDDVNIVVAFDARHMEIDDVSQTLTGGGKRGHYSLNNMPMVAKCLSRDGRMQEDVEDFVVHSVDEAPTLRTNERNNSNPGTPAQMHVMVRPRAVPEAQAISENQRAEVRQTDATYALTDGGGKPGQGYAAARIGGEVRKLTPTECVPLDTLILGDDKPIGDYREGDRIITASGTGRVTATMRRRYEGDMVTVRAQGLLPVLATPEHPVLVREGSKPKGRRTGRVVLGPPVWKPIGEVRPWDPDGHGDFLTIPRLPGHRDDDHIDLRPYGAEDVRNHAAARETRGLPTRFVLDEEGAWLFGLFVAEGCTSFVAGNGRVELTPGSDVGLAERAVAALRAQGFAARMDVMPTSLRVTVASSPLARMLRDLCGHLAHNKHVPEVLLAHRDECLLRAFLDGYLAGDGYERSGVNVGGANTASRVLALQLQLAQARLGVCAGVRKVERDPEHRIQGRAVARVRPFYAVTWRRNQPRHARHKVFDDAIAVPVRGVERNRYEGDVCNVETSDHTYLVGGAVVHNCERLQGFPDGWTRAEDRSLAGEASWYEVSVVHTEGGAAIVVPRVDDIGYLDELVGSMFGVCSPDEPQPDGHRYAAMGDAVTVPVAHWLGARLLAFGGDD